MTDWHLLKWLIGRWNISKGAQLTKNNIETLFQSEELWFRSIGGDVQKCMYLHRLTVLRHFITAKDIIFILFQSLEWRRSTNIDELLNWVPPEVLTTYFHHWYIGEDKFGCPRKINGIYWLFLGISFNVTLFQVYLSCFGKTDIRGILQCVSKEDYRNYVISFAEKSNREMERLSKVYGKNIKQGSMLVRFSCITRRRL